MKKRETSPPGLFLRFFRWFCHDDLKDYIEGDLMELYEERKNSSGKRKADLKFIIDVLLLFRPGIIRPSQGIGLNNNFDMFRNYFKTGIRNIFKYKAFSAINIFRLAFLLSGEFLKILGISMLIGIPLSYFANNFWLEMLPNHVNFSIWIVLPGTFILLLPGLLAIGSPILRASRQKPAESLKME